MSDQAPIQLRWFSNDCYERARMYHNVAAKALTASMNPHLSSADRWAILADLRDQVSPRSNKDPIADHNRTGGELKETLSQSALKTSELAARFGLSERGARKAIERGMGNGREGFGRIGGLLFAEPEAFARVIRKRAQPPPA